MKLKKELHPGLIVLFFGLAGIIFAGIEQVLYNEGVIINEFVTDTITMPALMTVTIILWLVVGIIIAMAVS